MVITVYVHLFFTLPWFSLVKLWENKLHKKSFPRTVRDWRQYKILGIWRYENYRSIYHTVYLDRSCLIVFISLQLYLILTSICTYTVSVVSILQMCYPSSGWFKSVCSMGSWALYQLPWCTQLQSAVSFATNFYVLVLSCGQQHIFMSSSWALAILAINFSFCYTKDRTISK
jgi:hypothetical protein